MPPRVAFHDDTLHGLLLTLCRRDAAGALEHSAVEPLGDPATLQRFLDLAAHHRVLGLTLAALSRSGQLSGLGDSAARECQERLTGLRRRAASIALERDHVVGALARAALRAVVLKGGALVGWIYRDAVERDVQDLDFLVAERDLRAAVRVFEAQGYALPRQRGAMLYFRRHHFHVPVTKGALLGADIHWALDRPSAAWHLDPRPFLADSREVRHPGGPTFRVPRPEHMILHLVLQCGGEGFGRLSRLVDVDRIVSASPGLCWDTLASTARSAGLGPSTALALRLAQLAFGTALPDSAPRELFPAAVARAHVALLGPAQLLFEEQLERTHGRRHLLAAWLADGARRRLRFVAGLVAPERTFPPDKERRRPLERLLRLPKLLLSQAAAYARATRDVLSPHGRAQMRFWSRKASRSESR